MSLIGNAFGQRPQLPQGGRGGSFIGRAVNQAMPTQAVGPQMAPAMPQQPMGQPTAGVQGFPSPMPQPMPQQPTGGNFLGQALGQALRQQAQQMPGNQRMRPLPQQ
jgi:hypothetical protein